MTLHRRFLSLVSKIKAPVRCSVTSTMAFSVPSTPDSSQPPSQAEILKGSITTPFSPETENALATATKILQKGGLVAFPTETVYGLGASALSEEAVRCIYKAKGRPSDNPLIVHVASKEMMYKLIPNGKEGVPKPYHLLIEKFCPGPLSLIFSLVNPTQGSPPPEWKVCPSVLAGHTSVALRIPSHPLALALIERANLPLAAPSANMSSRPSPTSAKHVFEDMGRGRGVGAILDGGECDVGVESTVVDFVKDNNGVDGHEEGSVRILRAGGVSAEDIERCLREANYYSRLDAEKPGRPAVKVYNRDFSSVDLEDRPTTPGMKYKHYSPTNSKVVLVRPVFKTLHHPPSQAMNGVSQAPLPDLEQLTDQLLPLKSEGARIGLMLSDETLSRLGDTLNLVPNSLQRNSPVELICHKRSSYQFLPYSLGRLSHPSEAAQRLFAGLRYFDSLNEPGAKTGVDLIYIESLKENGVGLAVMERARKAAGGEPERSFAVENKT